MQAFLEPKSDGRAFQLFSTEHVLTLAVILLICGLLFVFGRQIRRSGQSALLRAVLAALLLLAEIGFQFWSVYYGTWTLQSSLPLEVSNLAVIFAAVMLLTGWHPLFSILYYAGIGSSLLAILTPDMGSYTFPHFRYIEFFVAHGGMILAVLYMIAVERYRPPFRWLWGSFLLVNVYGICIFFLNRVIGANYLYLMRKPESASMMVFLGDWPWYLFSMEALMLVVFLLLYLPFGLIENRGKRRSRDSAPEIRKKHQIQRR